MKRLHFRIAAAATAVFVALSCALYWIAARRTGGTYTYPIDDAYIHLALAKNIATHGVYGLHEEGFTAASSSIGWPLLLGALYRIWPSSNVAALASLGCAACVPLAVRRALTNLPEVPLSGKVHGAAQALVVLATPLVPLALSGMEHTAHALVLLLLVTECVGVRASEASRWRSLRLGLLAFFATTLRYESFSTCALCILFLARTKAFERAAVVAVAAILPPVAFALYSKAHGWNALPNSVILKARRWDGDMPGHVLAKLREAPHLPLLFVLLATALFLTRRGSRGPGRKLAWVALGTLVAHTVFGAVGWFYRYEAYLLPLSIVALALLLADLRTERSSAPKAALAIAGAMLLLLPRGFSALRALPYASRNIFDEQVRTARFLDDNFAGEEVLVNDIGAVAYFSKTRVVDLMGLANQETARARGMRIDRPLAPGTLEKLSTRTNVAVVYEQWFRGEIPPGWTKVGAFETTNNRVCAFPEVAIYATKPSSVSRVRAAFERDEPW
ncbi:MAG: hypothetical protein U0174_11495 [Polyangiaceae bacterium]